MSNRRLEGFIEGRAGSGCYVSTFAAPAATMSGVISFKPPAPNDVAARKPAKREPRLARRGQRMRELFQIKIPGRQHRGLRYNLQYGMPMTNPQLASAWRRELSHAAAQWSLDYRIRRTARTARGHRYLARRRGHRHADDILIVSGCSRRSRSRPKCCRRG